MTEVHFYTGVADPMRYACELIRRGVAKGRRLVVHDADRQRLARFDQALWTFEPLSFIPHVAAGDALAPRTPVILTPDGDAGPEALPHHEVLVNLGGEPKFFSRFDFLMEIVGRDPADAEAGRRRWKFYKDRGYRLEHHPQENKR
ncbi:DNA polymerase III subunit chi [Derxia gummosa]|uniref:DNA polymerase III subunit chi n=1 Tax=Derxia gummosa DSM 723 TaxID=1121388 RepID=A0A8B6X6G0_9BURK|nr:DNA polymerase III subunit chi [Derxia gummosa]